uniref:Pancreatic trypsin inhibitor n=1 Tax=Rhipicephalus appendiculatus TaxID=34631 RepID=A0A131YIX6_RHIAP
MYTLVLLVLLPVALNAARLSKDVDFATNCDTEHACMYPEACKICPPKPLHGYIRKPFFYNNQTGYCEESSSGVGDGCNAFDTFDDCEFKCGLESSEEEND